jgi:hypothetical protein
LGFYCGWIFSASAPRSSASSPELVAELWLGIAERHEHFGASGSPILSSDNH